MTHAIEWLTYRLAELHLHSTVLLAAALLLLSLIRQPAGRIAMAWASLWGLSLLLVLPAAPGRALIRLPAWTAFAWAQSGQRSNRVREVESAGDALHAELLKAANLASDDVLNGEGDDVACLADDAVDSTNDSEQLKVGIARRALAVVEIDSSASDPAAPVARSWSLEPRGADIRKDDTQSGAAWAWIASAIWIAGSLLAAIWAGMGAVSTRRLLWRSRQAPEWMHHELNGVVPEHRRRPRLRINDEIGSALACGAVRPTILLPERNDSREHQTGIRAALAHEWAHIANGDLWLLALERLLLPVYFAQPLYWLLRRRIRVDQELLADAAAAGQTPVAYAEMLLAWARSSSVGPHGEALAALSFWNNPCHLTRRIEMLLDTTNRIVPQTSRLWRTTALTAVVVFVGGLSLITCRPARLAANDPEVEPANPAGAATETAISAHDQGVGSKPSATTAKDPAARPTDAPPDNVARDSGSRVTTDATKAEPDGRDQTQALYAALVEKFKQLFREKQFHEALLIGKKASLLEPDNPVSELMVLKAKFAKQDALQILQDKKAGVFAGQSKVDTDEPSAKIPPTQAGVTQAEAKYEFAKRLAKKGYAVQHEVDAARAEFDKAKAVLESAHKKAAEASEIDELRKLVSELRDEIRRLRQKSPEKETTAPPGKNLDEADGQSVELQLLKLDVDEAEVDVAAAKAAYDTAAQANDRVKGSVPEHELSARKLAMQKAQIAWQRAKLRLEAAKRPAAKGYNKGPTSSNSQLQIH
jgi:beta-lactamase regulating signal transducer with metallopeptidase domain